MLLSSLTYLIIITSLLIVYLELKHLFKTTSPLKLKITSSAIKELEDEFHIDLNINIKNEHKKMEVMIPNLSIETVLIGGKKSKNNKVIGSVYTKHEDLEAREDGYWPAYIVKANNSTVINVKLTLKTHSDLLVADSPKGIWVEIKWVNYGPFGIINRSDGLLVPLEKILKPSKDNMNLYKKNGMTLYPIKTHLLGILDDPREVCRKYIGDLIQPGDILTIGETPLAVMQGRYKNPYEIELTFLSRCLSRFFHPTSSLATACGMQTLIDLVGPTRVLLAWFFGACLKIIGIKGIFYRLAGTQARLIDDITGTTPPYDKTIVLGPVLSNIICKEISKDLGINVAIVDVNDLGKVKILASSDKSIEPILKLALVSNPAGNANEQTPLVLVRPC